MRKTLVSAATIAVAMTLVPPASAEGQECWDFSGQMVPIPARNGQVAGAGAGVYSAHEHVVEPGLSVMTAGNGCREEWHGMDMQWGTGFVRQAEVPGVGTRFFLWSHATTPDVPGCRDSSKLGGVATIQNGKAHVVLNTQETSDPNWQATWVLDCDTNS